MKRRLLIEVKTFDEFEAIKLAIQEPDVMAFLIIVGMLKPLEKRERTFVLKTVSEIFEMKKDRE